MPFAGFAVSEGTLTFLGIVVAGVAGNVVGSWIAYAVGYYGGRPFVDRWGKYVLLRPHHLDTAQHWFDKHGAPVVFSAACCRSCARSSRCPRASARCASGSSPSTPCSDACRGWPCSATSASSWVATGRRSARSSTTSTTWWSRRWWRW